MQSNPQLFRFQQTGVQYLNAHPRVGLFDEMGLGKTVQALHALPEGPTLVVCPKSLIAEWVLAVRRWAPDRQVYLVNETSPDGWVALQEGKGNGSLGLVNYAALPRYVEVLTKIPFELLIVDEAHYAKNRKAERSKNVKVLSWFIPRVFLLTGTPPLHKPEEMWHLLHILDPQTFKSYWRFFDRHVKYWTSPHGGKVPAGIRDDDAYVDVISPHFLRRRREEVLPDLPPLLSIDLPVDLYPIDRRAYDVTLQDRLRDGNIELRFPNVLAKLTALRKLALGFMPSGEEAPPTAAKVDVLVEKVRGLKDRQFIVFSHFVATKNMVHSHLEKAGVSTVDTKQLKKWRMGRVQGLVDTVYSGGLGLNLQQAEDMFLIEPPSGYTAYIQAIARIHRPSNKAPSHRRVWRIMSTNTVDEHFYGLLDSMEERANEIDLALEVWRSLKERALLQALKERRDA